MCEAMLRSFLDPVRVIAAQTNGMTAKNRSAIKSPARSGALRYYVAVRLALNFIQRFGEAFERHRNFDRLAIGADDLDHGLGAIAQAAQKIIV